MNKSISLDDSKRMIKFYIYSEKTTILYGMADTI